MVLISTLLIIWIFDRLKYDFAPKITEEQISEYFARMGEE